MVQETWEQPAQADENIISYVIKMRNRLLEMSEIVQENVSNAQQVQKKWYDRTAHVRQFNPGDHVLVLLPKSTHKLRVQWQGPFRTIESRGKVNYMVDMGDRRRRLRTFHINMLHQWHENDDDQLIMMNRKRIWTASSANSEQCLTTSRDAHNLLSTISKLDRPSPSSNHHIDYPMPITKSFRRSWPRWKEMGHQAVSGHHPLYWYPRRMEVYICYLTQMPTQCHGLTTLSIV